MSGLGKKVTGQLDIWYLGLNEMYVWFLLPTYPNLFNPTLKWSMEKKYLKWELFQILSLFSLLNVIIK